MTTTGLFSINDLRQVNYASAMKYGLDTINQVLAADLAQYNAAVAEQMRFLAEPLTEQARVYGTSAKIDMTEMDEFGRPISKKNVVGQTVAFPIKTFASALGWTEKFLQLHTPAELVAQYDQIRRGHSEQLLLQIKKAIFNSSNYSQTDPYNSVSLAVKRLINADSSVIPEFGGTTFAGASHTHYLATASGSFAATDIDALISTVAEHGLTKGLKVFVNGADIAAISALTGFTALSSSLLFGTSGTNQKLDMSDVSNYLAGLWDGLYEVWVKNLMIPSGYIMCVATDEVEKLLGFRQLPQPELRGLPFDAMFSDKPLVAQNAEAIFGFGVWNRLSGAVMSKVDTWANPTL